MTEDVLAAEGMQEGRASSVDNEDNFSSVIDNSAHQFHKWIATNIID